MLILISWETPIPWQVMKLTLGIIVVIGIWPDNIKRREIIKEWIRSGRIEV